MKIINKYLPFLIFLVGCNGNPHVQKKMAGVVLPKNSIEIEEPSGQKKAFSTPNGLVRINDTLCISPILPLPDSIKKVDGNKIEVYIEEEKLKPTKTDKIWLAENAKTHILIRSIEIGKSPYNTTQLIWGWVQMLISIGAVLIMIVVWNEHNKRQKAINLKKNEESDDKSSQDLGVFYLSAAFILWSSIGVITTYASDSVYYTAIIKFLSFINNFFFLLSFPYFNHGISYFKGNKASYLIVNLLIFISFLMALIIGLVNEMKGFVNYIDALFSCSTLIVFGVILCKSFFKRKLLGIAIIAVVWTFGALFTQVSDLIPGLSLIVNSWDKIIYFSSFVLIIILITALIFSWYHEQAKIEINQSFIKSTNAISNEQDPKIRYSIMLELITKNQFTELFVVLFFENKSDDKTIKEITHLSSRYSDLMDKYHQNLLSAGEHDNSLNKIRETAIELVHRTFNKSI